MNMYNHLTNRIDFLDTAMVYCMGEKKYDMANMWKQKAEKLEQRRDLIAINDTIAQPTGGYSF